MSDRITSPALSQDPSPESAVMAGVQASAEQAAQEEEQLVREADNTCKAAVRAFRKGENEYRKGLLEAGRLADLYVHQRMDLRHPRENAVKTLDGEFSRYAQKQREYAERVAKAQAEELARKRAERDAQDKARAEMRAAEKVVRAPAPRPKDVPQESRATNLLASAKQGTAKDVGAMAAVLITGCEAPDDAFEEQLRRLKTSGEMSKQSIRAIDAAMLRLNKDAKPEPATNAEPAAA